MKPGKKGLLFIGDIFIKSKFDYEKEYAKEHSVLSD